MTTARNSTTKRPARKAPAKKPAVVIVGDGASDNEVTVVGKVALGRAAKDRLIEAMRAAAEAESDERLSAEMRHHAERAATWLLPPKREKS